MKYAFIITSAINSKFGSIAKDQRMSETIETIKSINECVPTADTYLIDMCGDPLTDEQKSILAPLVTMISDYSSDPQVQKIYALPSQDIVKNLTEMICFGNFLTRDTLGDGMWNRYDRIFKISGRYRLNSNIFTINDYQVGFPGIKKPEYANKMIFSGIYNSQFDPAVTGNPPDRNYQYMSRLWSFDPTLIDVIRSAYEKMVTNMIERLNAGGYIDIEHLLFKHMPYEHTAIKTPVGLTGGIAPNGMVVND